MKKTPRTNEEIPGTLQNRARGRVDGITRLTRKQIEELHWNCFDDVSYAQKYMNAIDWTNLFHETHREKDLLNTLSDKKVIELGPGLNPFNTFFPCGTYTGVQPHTSYPETQEKYILNDGLSYLRELPDKSAVIISFWMMDSDILLHTQYAEELCEEIRRVAFPFAVIVGSQAMYYMGQADIPSKTSSGGIYIFDEEMKKEYITQEP